MLGTFLKSTWSFMGTLWDWTELERIWKNCIHLLLIEASAENRIHSDTRAVFNWTLNKRISSATMLRCRDWSSFNWVQSDPAASCIEGDYLYIYVKIFSSSTYMYLNIYTSETLKFGAMARCQLYSTEILIRWNFAILSRFVSKTKLF